MFMTLPDIDPQKEIQIITKFISNSFQEADKATAVVAISGGIDSATSLSLTSKALGPENVLALHLPSKNTNPQNTKDALTSIKSANIPDSNVTIINIGSIIQKSWNIIKQSSQNPSHYQKGEPNKKAKNASIIKDNKLRLANLQARIRMMLIFDHAKKNNALVVGTENLSEHILGYYTRFGDEASDLEPIRHLFKTQVYDLARHLSIPQEIINKPPSADLWKKQTDKKELGFSYLDADPILYLHNQGKSINEISKEGFDQSLINKVLTVVSNNAFKHQTPHTI
jgi:NAD+ synthase